MRTMRNLIRVAVMATAGLSLTVDSQAALIPDGTITVRLEQVTGGLQGNVTTNVFDVRPQLAPIDMTPLGDGRQLIMTLNGQVRLLQANGSLAAGAYLDTKNADSAGVNLEVGNTSIAAHSGFNDSLSRGYGKFYTMTTEGPQVGIPDFDDGVTSHHSDVLTEWTINPSALSATSLQLGVNVTQREIFRSRRPSKVHTMVDMAFGNNEYLYITSGEGGNSSQAQDPTNIFGTVLRIDPLTTGVGDTRTTGGHLGQYYIHPGNFYALDGDANTPGEIFAIGLRSPYRINADSLTGDIYVGDVGANSWEEINLVFNSGNYGWADAEGAGGSGGQTDPLYALTHGHGGTEQTEATTIIGGFVYRGSAIPELIGKYVFGEFGEDNSHPTNEVDLLYGDLTTDLTSVRDDFFGLIIDPSGEALPERIYSLAQDADGELYILGGPDRFNFFNGTDGTILKVTAVPEPQGFLLLVAGLLGLVLFRPPARTRATAISRH